MKSFARSLVFAALLFASFPASAQKLVVFNEFGGFGGSPREYYTFDPATASKVLRSTQASPERFFSLETQPSTGAIYGIEPGASALYKINVNTGSATFVAPTGLASIANMTFHPTTGVLYAVGRASTNLYTIDHVSGASTLIGNCMPVRAGLEFSPSGTLYGTDSIGTLYTINTSTAVPTLIGGGGGPGLVEDAEFTAAGKLYLTDYDGSIHEVNPATGASVTVGNTGLGNGQLGIVEEPRPKLVVFNEFGGFGGSPREYYTFDPATGAKVLRSTQASTERFFSLETQPSTGVIYGIEPAASALYKVNVNTGSATFVAATGLASIANMTFHPTTGVLYAVGRASTNLYTIDHVSGASTLIGNCLPARAGLEFSPSGTLYGTDSIGTLYTINTSTAVPTLIGGGGGPGLVEDAEFTAAGKLYLTDYDGSIHEVDPATGASVTVGSTGLGNGLLGIVEEPASCPAPAAYCTAKTNSLGCVPAINFSGTPSATATSGFVVGCTNVLSNKSGLLFYGVTGRAAAPFQGGFLCIASQVKRTPGQLSTGGLPTSCLGTYSIDMNAFAQGLLGGSPHPALKVVGTEVDCQWWSRDPGYSAPNNTGLTNALEFQLCL